MFNKLLKIVAGVVLVLEPVFGSTGNVPLPDTDILNPHNQQQRMLHRFANVKNVRPGLSRSSTTDLDRLSSAERAERTKVADSILSSLQIKPEEQLPIALNTAGRFKSPEYIEKRELRFTSSNFGVVFQKTAIIDFDPLAEKLLHSSEPTDDPVVLYGRANREKAINKFAAETKLAVTPCGIFIDVDNGCLSATPDGVIEEEGILLVHCPYSIKDYHPLEGPQHNNNLCYTVQDGQMALKREHFLYNKVQAQLYIARMSKCYFAVWTEKGLIYEVIEKEPSWAENISKLKEFYVDVLLPTIVEKKIKEREGESPIEGH